MKLKHKEINSKKCKFNFLFELNANDQFNDFRISRNF